jgi:hypothetical protein
VLFQTPSCGLILSYSKTHIRNGKVSSSLAGPPPPIAWAQWLDPEKRTKFPVKAILGESVLDKTMPPWNELILTWHELKTLPTLWIERLSQWRAIYFILDAADGKGYVGSTYGEKNLYGRWKSYADSGDAGNKLLRKPRKPDKFRFSILQRVCHPTWSLRISSILRATGKIACIRAYRSASTSTRSLFPHLVFRRSYHVSAATISRLTT